MVIGELKKRAGTGQAAQDNLGQDSWYRTTRAGKPVQGNQEKTAEEDNQEKTAGEHM